MRANITEALMLAVGGVAACGAACAGSSLLGTAPWAAHAETMSDQICERLATENLWQVTHGLAWHQPISIPEVVRIAFDAVHTQCPEMAWRLPEPEAPAPASRPPHTGTQPQPQEPGDYYGDEPGRFGNEELA